MAPKFDWSQFQTENEAPAAAPDAAAPAPAQAPGKFDWSQFEAEAPAAPASASFRDRIRDPDRWKAILGMSSRYNAAGDVKGQGSQFDDLEGGTPPMAVPAGAMGAVGAGLVKLGTGQGLGYAAGRTALAAGQGAAMSALDGQEGESGQDKIDRAKSGAKLSGGIQLAAESVPYVGKALGWGAKKVGGALTGVSDKLIENYANRTDQINDIIAQSGGDVTTAADNIRTELSKGIQRAKGVLNGQISSALEQAAPEASISAQPIIERLEAAKAKLNPNFKANAIADIDEMINNVKAQAGESGMLDARGLYETKQYLGSEAKGAYNKGGQIFTRASEAARAAKDAAGDARDLVKTHIPEISQADAQLSKMHAIEGRLNRNLLAPGTPDGALLAAGSGANARNAANLRALQDISGVDVAQRSKDLATAKAFASPDLLSGHFTGRAVMGAALGGAIGGGADGKEGAGMGAIAGAAASSPMALKAGINVANFAGKYLGGAQLAKAAQAIRQNPFTAQTIAQLGASQIRRANMPAEPAAPEAPPARQLASPPAKGEAAWAQRGLQALGVSDPALSSRLMQDPKARALLIQAGSVSQGSKAMKAIQSKIQKGWGTP